MRETPLTSRPYFRPPDLASGASTMRKNDAHIPPVFRLYPIWFVCSAASAIAAWIWGSSEWPAHAFSFAFGISSSLIAICMIVATCVFLLGRTSWKYAHFARNDFANFCPWIVRRLHRGISALLGFGLVTALAWASIHSQNGAKLTLLCALFSLGLGWCAYCLQALLETQNSGTWRAASH